MSTKPSRQTLIGAAAAVLLAGGALFWGVSPWGADSAQPGASVETWHELPRPSKNVKPLPTSVDSRGHRPFASADSGRPPKSLPKSTTITRAPSPQKAPRADDKATVGLPRGKRLPAGGMVGAIRAQVADKDLGLLSHLGKRLGKPAPPIVWQLLKRKRAGATEEELLAFIRTRFPKDLRLRAETVAWLERQAGGGATPADVLPKNRLSPERRARLRRVLERVGRGVRKQAANKTP